MLAAHMRQHGTGDGQQTEDIGAVEGLDLGTACLFDRTEQSVAGIVDQNIDPAKACDRLPDGLMRLGLVGDIERHGQKIGLRAETLDTAAASMRHWATTLFNCRVCSSSEAAAAAACSTSAAFCCVTSSICVSARFTPSIPVDCSSEAALISPMMSVTRRTA